MIRCADGHRIFLATFLKLSETLISNLQSIQDSFHKCPSSDVNIRRWALLQSSAFHALLRVPCANHAGNQFFAQRIRHVSLCLCVMLKADNIECVLTWRCCVVCVDEGLTVQQRWRWPTEQPSLFRRQHSQLSNHQYSLHSEHISITLSYTLTAHPCRHTRWRTTHRCTMSQQHQCWQSHAVRCLNMLCCKLCHQNRRTHEVMKLNHHLDCSLCVCVCGWGQRHHTTMHDHMLMFVVVGGVYWWCVVNSVDHLARFVKVSVEHQVSPSSLLFSLKISKSLAKNWQRITHSLWEGSIRRRRRDKRKKHVIFTTTNDTYMMSMMKLRPTCWHTMLTLQTSFCVTPSCSYPIGEVWKYTWWFFLL